MQSTALTDHWEPGENEMAYGIQNASQLNAIRLPGMQCGFQGLGILFTGAAEAARAPGCAGGGFGAGPLWCVWPHMAIPPLRRVQGVLPLRALVSLREQGIKIKVHPCIRRAAFVVRIH